MEPFRYHLYVCDQHKPEGVPSCSSRGSEKLIEALRREIAAQGLSSEVQVTVCGSLGLCERGPNMVVYPEGVWYSGVQPEDVPEIVRSHFQQGQVVHRLANKEAAALKEEVQSNREKMLAAIRAREASGELPEDLLQTIRGYQESRAMLTAIELDAFTAVGKGADAGQVAATLGTNPRATEMLLNALVAMGMLTKHGGVYGNTPAAARYFVAGSADDARAAMLHTVHLWDRWSTLTECVRVGTSVVGHEAAERNGGWTEAFIAAMHRNATARSPLVVRALEMEHIERMLDVGGGSGAYAIAFARANPQLHVELLDLPAVLPIAKRHIERAGLSDRIRTRAGDLRTDHFGGGFDLVYVSAICHMLSPDEVCDLLRRCYEAVKPNGRVVINDFILEPDKTAPKFAALFALNMLVGTQAGSSYSEEEYAAWLRATGFQDVRRIGLPGPASLMVGTRR